MGRDIYGFGSFKLRFWGRGYFDYKRNIDWVREEVGVFDRGYQMPYE